ncbi:MAG: DUF4998 domain-containing protein [Bacteroidales bacterium]|jgi:hypothetical protein|nr:DUF4998 domain-containing protein [Bacteroidales bacterium]
MKRLIYLLVALLSFCYDSCSDQYENVDKYAGEVVYPAGFDTIFARIGYERVELDLMKIGRIPSSQLKLGKASKTIVEYDGVKQLEIDSVCSWVNITNLTESKLYRFKVYTEDEYGNPSVPQEIALIPFTELDRDLLGIASPKLTVSPTALVAEWPNGLNSVAMEYYGLSYSYTDKDGDPKSSTTTGTRFYCGNLEAGQKVTIDIGYKVLPIVDEVKILDTIIVPKAMEIEMPTASTPFSPTELVALRANGITTFTSEAVASVTKLTLPLHIGTLADLFYFSNLEELDLTGKDLPNVLPELTLSGSGYTYVIGGGSWQPYMRRIEYTEIFQINPAIAAQQTLLDLLESGMLKKVTYIKKSMSLDDLLEPYIASGVVELVDESWYPAEAPIDIQLLHPGNVQTSSFNVSVDYPAATGEVPNPGDITNPDKVYKVAPINRNATFSFTLPKEYMYDFERYRYMKFKVYISGGDEVKNGTYSAYRKIWPRIRYSFWGVDQGNNPYGSGDNWEWKPGGDRDQYQVPITNVSSAWTEITIDMKQVTDKIKAQDHSESYNPRSGHYHSRNICINLGAEQGPDPYNPDSPITYYFADIRLTKAP